MRTPQTVPVIAALLFATTTLAARAAAPANDSFASPTIVTGLPATATGSNVDATLQANESLPDIWDGNGEASVWFRWTAPTSGAVRIDTLGSDFDTMLAVWTGTAVNALTLLAENDEYHSSQSAVFLSAASGTTYQIGVYGWIDARGAIALHITNDTTSKITGTVTGPDDVTPLAGIWAQAWQWNADWEGWDYVVEGETDADGNYAIQGLLAGTYRVRFIDYDENYVAEIYSNAPDFDAGTDIVVPAATTVSNINAGLATAAGISGTVWGPDGITPLENIQVTVYHQVEGGWTGYATWTDAVGNYLVGGLTGGTYRVWFEGGSYISEAYSNAPSLDAGMDIVVPAGTVVSNINASLAAASGISGTVTGPDGVTPLEGHWIQAYRWNADWEEWDWIADDDTDENGFYSIRGLTPGTYRVWFNGGGNYVSEAYSNAPSLDAGMDIVVSVSTTISNINAALSSGGSISGTVTGPDGVAPLQNVYVYAYLWIGADWNVQRQAFTDSQGRYVFNALPPGRYQVGFGGWHGNYQWEAYNDAADIGLGTDIDVAEGASIQNIDAALVPSGSFLSQLLRIQNMGTGAFALSVTGTPDRVYMAQWAASLTGSWVNVGWAFYPGDDAITLTPTGPAGFWRIILAP